MAQSKKNIVLMWGGKWKSHKRKMRMGRCKSLPFTPTRLQAIRHPRTRYASAASQVSEASYASLESTASEFLEAKIEQLTQYKAYVDLVREGILDAHNQQPLPFNEFAQHIEPVWQGSQRRIQPSECSSVNDEP